MNTLSHPLISEQPQLGRTLKLAVLVLLLWAIPNASSLQGEQPDLYDRAQRACVEILVDRRLAGSGSIIDAAGTVLTAAHVVVHANDDVEILNFRGDRWPARVVALDRGHDLAILALPGSETEYPALPLAEQMPQAGSTAFLFGAPLFRHAVLVRGAVARNDTTYEFVDGHYVEVFHYCAPAAKGLSGGPWLDDQGRIIGVQSSTMSIGDAQQGISFGSPLSAIQHLVRSRETCAVASMGAAVEEIWEQPRPFLNTLSPDVKGVVVRALASQGPAADSGLANGMIITAVDDRPIQFRNEFARMLRSHRPGEVMRLSVVNPDGSPLPAVEVRLVDLGGQIQAASAEAQTTP